MMKIFMLEQILRMKNLQDVGCQNISKNDSKNDVRIKLKKRKKKLKTIKVNKIALVRMN